jgi:RAD51-like protein 2
MASALSEHLLALLKKGAEKKLPDSLLDAVSTSSLLANIHVLRVHDHAEQMAAVRMLPSFCASHPGVRLIVLDSIAFHFRHAFHDMAHRTRVLSDMLQQLNKVARSHQLAVLLVNQMTTQVLHDSSRVVPALGDTLAHAVTNRVVLYWKVSLAHERSHSLARTETKTYLRQEERRIAHLNKSSRLPEGEAEFAVLQSGIRKPPPKCRSAKRYKSDDVHL